jgi:hypothetical protein
LFSSDGDRIGGEFQISTNKENIKQNPQVTSLSGDIFVVCWENLWQDGSGKGLYGQLFSSDGTRIGSEFRVNTYTEDWQEKPQIESLPGGGFMVCWESREQDGSATGIYGQLFSSDGDRIGSEFQINTYTENNQANPQITSLSVGGFVVCWQSKGQDGSGYGIYGKRYPEFPLLHGLKPFYLLQPLNDSSVKAVNQTLVWRQPSNQVVCYPWELHYKIYMDDNPNFISPQIIEQDQDTTSLIRDLTPGTTYFWKVLAKNIADDSLWSSNTNGFFVSADAMDIAEEKNLNQPNRFILHQNYPNPFNPETKIRFDLPKSGFIVISIYDISGKLVRILTHESRTAGSYSIKWDSMDSAGNPSPSGIYVCRMEVRSANGERFVQSVKMGLVR